MTPLEHSDHIIRSKPNETILVCAPTRGTNMQAGGEISYPVGSRMRVKMVTGDLIWCLDDEGRTVTFDREGMGAMERGGRGNG